MFNCTPLGKFNIWTLIQRLVIGLNAEFKFSLCKSVQHFSLPLWTQTFLFDFYNGFCPVSE